MQGIRLFEYKTLLESLSKLRQIEIFDLSEEQAQLVIEKEKKLKEIYASYQQSLEQVSETIRQFDQHKNAIRRLMKKSRHYLKDPKKQIKVAVSVD